MIVADWQVSLRMITEELNISKDSISTTVHEHLRKWKICAWFEQHMLTNELKQTWMEMSGDFTDMCDQNPHFWKPSLQEMRPGTINMIQIPSDNQGMVFTLLPAS